MTKVLFGHQRVTPEEKSEKVDNVFTDVADVYDTMNDAMSIGIHRLWKQQAVSALDLLLKIPLYRSSQSFFQRHTGLITQKMLYLFSIAVPSRLSFLKI